MTSVFQNPCYSVLLEQKIEQPTEAHTFWLHATVTSPLSCLFPSGKSTLHSYQKDFLRVALTLLPDCWWDAYVKTDSLSLPLLAHSPSSPFPLPLSTCSPHPPPTLSFVYSSSFFLPFSYPFFSFLFFCCELVVTCNFKVFSSLVPRGLGKRLGI